MTYSKSLPAGIPREDFANRNYAGDYGLVLGVTTISIIGVSVGVLVIDLVYPFLDPRVQVR